MKTAFIPIAAALAGVAAYAAQPAGSGPTDPQIAHIAYTAGVIDVAAAQQALAKSQDPAVRAFAATMVRDHQAVNVKALALVERLKVTPQDNAVSAALSGQATASMKRLAGLNGTAFDHAYVRQEADYHKAVNSALRDTLIPSADNNELKALLQSGLALFGAHQSHAETLAKTLK